MKKIKEYFKWELEDILKVLIGSFLFCFAINVFIVPNNLYNGGVLGISQLIRSICIDVLKIKINFDFSGILYYIINIPLFIVAYKLISKTFFRRTVFAVTIQMILLSLIPAPSKPLVDDLLVCITIGGIIAGTGAGMALSAGASTGGTDIVGIAIARKNKDFSVGKLGLIINIIIYTIAGIIYGLEIMIYSIIYSLIASLTTDKMHDQNICQTALIFTKKNPIKINNFIKKELGRDFTYWDAKGGYDDSKTYIIYTVLSRYELQRLERHLGEFDEHAFCVKTNDISVKGKFDKKL